MATDQKTVRKKDMQRLRHKLDGDDGFMRAHQIKKIRTRERDIPAWTLNDAEVRKVLLRAFPSMRNSRVSIPLRPSKKKSRQASRSIAQRAGRWMRIIHLYYRVQMSNSQIAKEMNEKLNAVKMTLKSIRRVARGQRTDNVGPLKIEN